MSIGGGSGEERRRHKSIYNQTAMAPLLEENRDGIELH
jgi:hypothetical protein